MVNKQRPDDYIESPEPDVEGHRHILNVNPDIDADTEGHSVRNVNPDAQAEAEDTEGHSVRNINPDAQAEAEDTEGHRHILNVNPDIDADVEGHGTRF